MRATDVTYIFTDKPLKKVFVSYWLESHKSIKNNIIDVDMDNFNIDTIKDMEKQIKELENQEDCVIINWKVI